MEFHPRGSCYLWDGHLIALHVYSDTAIAIAFLAIPLLLWQMTHERPYLKTELRATRHLTWWFGAFIFLCGLTHVLEVVTIWAPLYYLAGTLKALTALVSIAAAFSLARNLVKLFRYVDEGIKSETYHNVYEAIASLRRSA